MSIFEFFQRFLLIFMIFAVILPIFSTFLFFFGFIIGILGDMGAAQFLNRLALAVCALWFADLALLVLYSGFERLLNGKS